MSATAKTIEHETGTALAESKAQLPASEGMMLMEAIQRMCSNPDFDPKKMQQIIDMRKEMEKEHARIEFNAAMARVQSGIESVIADAHNDQTDSDYAKLATVVTALAPVYTAEGFSVSFGTDECASEKLREAGYFRTTAELAHMGGYSKNYHVDLPADTTGPKGQVNKTVIHGTKSAISYARVILMGLMFNFTTALDVDDDGNAAGKEPNPDNEPATDEQLAKIEEWREAGKIPDKTEEWIKKASPLTTGQAAHLLNELQVRNPK